jgi:glucose-6-phosphate dehydrogenase assembly protein OpcA
MTAELVSRIATVVVVGERERLAEGAAALERAGDAAAVLTILISTGHDPAPAMRHEEHAIVLEGLQPQFVNNAVAALRLSSLPTAVWWRGGDPERLEGLAALADRVVLDAEDPDAVWAAAVTQFERSAFSDLRWTRLTRWRALMANFFDIPDVRSSVFTHLQIEGSDAHAARLFGGWMRASLGWGDRLAIEHHSIAGHPIRAIRLVGAGGELMLQLAGGGTCVEAAAHVADHADAVRTVALGDQSLAAVIAEELRVRARDHAFEHALMRARPAPDAVSSR